MEHSLQKVEHDKVVSKARAWEESVKAKATNRCATLHSGHPIMPLFWNSHKRSKSACLDLKTILSSPRCISLFLYSEMQGV
jgi:hypothetical protein